jgi:hypothetical protein
MVREFQKQDGYEAVDDFTTIGAQTGAKKAKQCSRVTEFMSSDRLTAIIPSDEKGEKLRGAMNEAVERGNLPKGRYFAIFGSGTIGNGVIVSFPESDREELAKNADQGLICIWVDGPADHLEKPPNTKFFADQWYHVAVNRWDGVLRHPEPAAVPPEPAASGAVAGP